MTTMMNTTTENIPKPKLLRMINWKRIGCWAIDNQESSTPYTRNKSMDGQLGQECWSLCKQIKGDCQNNVTKPTKPMEQPFLVWYRSTFNPLIIYTCCSAVNVLGAKKYWLMADEYTTTSFASNAIYEKKPHLLGFSVRQSIETSIAWFSTTKHQRICNATTKYWRWKRTKLNALSA